MQNSDNYKLKFSKGKTIKQGATVGKDGLQFCCCADCKQSIFLYLYDRAGKILTKTDLLPYRVAGNLFSVFVEGLPIEEGGTYGYEIDGELCDDRYKKMSSSKRKWGETDLKEENLKGGFYQPEFDWEGDTPLKLPFSQVISYSMHVRGFTKHASSGVKEKGTFLGIVSKIPYLKELGINQIELLPAYEFYELDSEKEMLPKGHPKYEAENQQPVPMKMNYWGFKEGSYFIPKTSYAYGNDVVAEFKTLVKCLHQNGIELVMQFYFPEKVNRNLILDCLDFWVTDYHVDGFHIKGEQLPIDLIATRSLLADTKLYYTYYNRDSLLKTEDGINHYIAEVNPEYMTDMRRFLKSDEDMLQAFLYRQRRNPSDVHVINYLTAYEGFTLNDLVSYDYKHNDTNGEDNKDGSNYNYSWNCGIEGATRKKAVQKLRMKQMKNAMVLLLLSQGTPMILAGDEFCNTQLGNNNAYCQDNEVTWLNWKQTKQSQEMLSFVKELITLRKAHPILHKEEELRIMDYAACGYPDLSYHGDSAWYPKLDTHIRHVGVMLCGKYARIDRMTEDAFFFIAYNMHWEPHHFGLPKLPKGMSWQFCFATEEELGQDTFAKALALKQEEVTVPERTILVLIGKAVPEGLPDKK